MAKAILNYTTTVPVSRTIGHVQALLVEAGARQITTEYDDAGTPTGMHFVVQTAFGPRCYVLPVRADKVQGALARAKLTTRQTTPEHAERVAWRILKDWLEVQLALLQVDMASLDQVMLPYMTDDDGVTLYELYVGRQLAIEAPK